MPLKTFAECLC